jgi:hypothetical protein
MLPGLVRFWGSGAGGSLMSTPPDLPPLERLHTIPIPAAADWLALKPRTLYSLIAEGRLAVAHPTKRAIRIPESELRRLMRATAENRRASRIRGRRAPAGVAD